MPKLLLSLLVAGLCWVPTSFAQDAWSLTLVVRETLDKNPGHKQIAEKVNEAQAGISLARSSYFPTVDALAYAKTAKDAGNSPSALFGATTYNAYSFSVDARQPLIHWGFFSSVSAPQRARDIARY